MFKMPTLIAFSQKSLALRLFSTALLSYSCMESAIEQNCDQPVDRQKTCPLLLRVFLCKNRHNPLIDYSRGNVPSKELQIYTWKDATLKEIASLVKEVHPEARKKGTRFEFAFVFPDARGPSYRRRDIGSVTSGIPGDDDKKTLGDSRLQIGDYMDIAIIYPERREREPFRKMY